jgi:hypothetical protein
MAQVVSRLPVHVGFVVETLAFSLSISVVPCQYHSTSVPCSFTHLSLI